MEVPPLTQAPNPLTPLAWLPPDIANQLEASRYLYSATIGAWIWDCLTAIPEDVRLFKTYGFNLSDVVYLISRTFTCIFLSTSLAFQVAAVSDCHALAKVIGTFAALSLCANCFLFFLRVRAVFHQQPHVIGFFFFLWIAVVAGTLSAPFGVDGTHIQPTQHCVNSNVKQFASAGIIIVAVHDLSVFLAISWRLSKYVLPESRTARFKAFLSGKGLGRLSRSLLQTGQLYYLATVGLNIVAMVVILTPSVPPVLAAMFTIPNIALQNAMACRVFRQIKLGVLKNPANTTGMPAKSITTPIQFVTMATTTDDTESALPTTPSRRPSPSNGARKPPDVVPEEQVSQSSNGVDPDPMKGPDLA
ncbi:hypothetical protein C8Q75DRAFT_351708 [Abortiporus biennis]|nr:hypothetical protein C8Q75DRAFT_351708 [Abortiporus biennis]